MKTGTRTLIAIGVAATVGGTSLAAVGHGKGHYALFAPQIFDSIDTNRDGKLSQEEIDQVRNDRHATHDANGDGSFSLEEFTGLWQETMRPFTLRAFQKLDIDGDAIVTRAEYDRPFDGIVERLDRDGDGGLSMRDRWHGRRVEHRRHGN